MHSSIMVDCKSQLMNKYLKKQKKYGGKNEYIIIELHSDSIEILLGS